MLLPSLTFSLLAALALSIFIKRNPATDPRITIAIFTCLLILPLLNFLPKFYLTLPSTESTLPKTPTSLWILPGIWTLGFLYFGLRGLIDVLSMQRWNRESRLANELPVFQDTLTELHIRRKIDLRIHPRLASPVVSGLIRPRIYLPESSLTWAPDTLKMALLHELGHVQRRDLWMAAMAHIVCVLHWFNPAVWWLRRTFLSQCEYACDAHLLKKGADPKTYAHALCDVAQSASAPPLSLAMAGHVPLLNRIKFLTNSHRRGSITLLALIALTAGSAIAMSVIKITPRKPAPAAPADPEIALRFHANPFPADN